MNRLDTDTATVVGLWIGVAGVVTGVAGIGLTLYSFFKDKPDVVVLTSSGWVAAVLCAITMGWVGTKLVRLLSLQTQEIAELTFKLTEITSEQRRLVTVSEYLASKAIRQTTRKQSASENPDSSSSKAKNGDPVQ